MKKISYKKINNFIAKNIVLPFYEKRLKKLQSISFKMVVKRKNPYLFKAKNIETAGDLACCILDAFLSSQEETIFGDLLENFAIFICKNIFNGYKAEQGKFKSVDLIFERDNKIYVVGIKSGPNWGNSDQINAMKRNFQKAKEILYKKGKRIIAVNGCMYGKDKQPQKKGRTSDRTSYFKICGQSFWELISGDEKLYKKIIQPLGREAKKRDVVFQDLYVKKINELTKDIVQNFYKKNMLDWDKIIDFVSKTKE